MKTIAFIKPAIVGVALALVAATNKDPVQAIAFGTIAVVELFHFAVLISDVGSEPAKAPAVVKAEFDGMGAP
jgi:hypothetical protein